LGKLFSGRVLFLAGANHPERDDHPKINSFIDAWVSANSGKKMEGQVVKCNLLANSKRHHAFYEFLRRLKTCFNSAAMRSCRASASRSPPLSRSSGAEHLDGQNVFPGLLIGLVCRLQQNESRRSRREPGLWLEEVLFPQPAAMMLIRVLKASICGLRAHLQLGRLGAETIQCQ
jgi:hypothetical protein